MSADYSLLTSSDNYFEDFEPGRRIRHARGATIDEVENNYITKQVMNTAQGHWNEAITNGSEFGDGRVVFGLVTGSIVVGLCSQDTAENAIAELSLTGLRFKRSVHHGDTIYAYTEVLDCEPSVDVPDAGVVTYKHWGVNQHGDIVCEMQRTVLLKRRSFWNRPS